MLIQKFGFSPITLRQILDSTSTNCLYTIYGDTSDDFMNADFTHFDFCVTGDHDKGYSVPDKLEPFLDCEVYGLYSPYRTHKLYDLNKNIVSFGIALRSRELKDHWEGINE